MLATCARAHNNVSVPNDPPNIAWCSPCERIEPPDATPSTVARRIDVGSKPKHHQPPSTRQARFRLRHGIASRPRLSCRATLTRAHSRSGSHHLALRDNLVPRRTDQRTAHLEFRAGGGECR